MNQPLVHLVQTKELKGQAREIFDQMQKNTGKVPKWMKVMANCPDILVGFFTLFKATMDNTPLDSKLKWKLAYIVSKKNKCDFCVDVSAQKLKSLDMSDEEINNVYNPENNREQLAYDYAEAASEHAYNIDQSLLKRVKAEFTDAELVELTSVVGLFNFINRFNDSLGVLPEIK